MYTVAPRTRPAAAFKNEALAAIKTIASDKLLRYGWAILFISAFLFCLPLVTGFSANEPMALFAIHYGMSITYFFILRTNRPIKIEEHRVHYQLLKLMLFLISAYVLNREMEVFATSPAWFSVLLVTVCASYVVSAFFPALPKQAAMVLFFVYGVAVTVFAYLTLYLVPMYAISLAGLVLLAISVHTFIPVMLVVATISVARQLAANNKKAWLSFAAGITVSVLVCIGFAALWTSRVKGMNGQYNLAMADGDDKLPLWVQVAQQINEDAVTEKVLKSSLLYKVPDWNDNFLWRMPTRNFGEEKPVHDPLVVIASLFSGPVLLPVNDRIKILESQYNARHQGLQRLWGGDHLHTQQLTTGVKLWPSLHLAYTEKLVTVYNQQSAQAWGRPEEAIYTFHLPEGGVVTSLSLWINGVEAKGILTSQQKATTAYNNIVGVQKRDPSVVHWQEGNTVSVRVYPVAAQSSRTFKLGVTAPLRKNGNQVVYDNIWFDGPEGEAAEEAVKIDVVDGENKLLTGDDFSSVNGKTYTRQGSYKPVWSVSMEDAGLAPAVFSFNGYSYSMKPYQRQRVPVNITDVYLDVNRFWTTAETEAVWKQVQNKKVWVYANELVALNADNKDQLFATLRKQNFSLLPFQLISNTAQSLVVAKSGGYSPAITDLEGSAFLNNLQQKNAQAKRVKLFHIGSEISPYLRSLNERRMFDFEYGTTTDLAGLLTQQLFVTDQESDTAVVVHGADVVITKETGTVASTAPDHLMRLFAYNHIMQQAGRKDSASGTDSTALITEAQQAYVVSPVSSLVVLETQADYDRFDIKDGQQSLKNASLKNNGSVPEPAEWAIIFLAGGAFLFFVYKTKFL